jgi:hypothetical protein
MKAGATGSPEVGLVNGTARQEELVPAVIRWSDEAPHAGKLSASDGPRQLGRPTAGQTRVPSAEMASA